MYAQYVRNKIVKILFDSGASASIVSHSYVHRNYFSMESTNHQWTTTFLGKGMARTFSTNCMTNIKLKLQGLIEPYSRNKN